MTWFRRGHDDPPPAPDAGEDEDSPQHLLRLQWELVQFINRNAGKLPVEAVVTARGITDRVREVIDAESGDHLDVYAVVQIKGIVGDYLPTTLRSYLNLDPRVTEQVGPSGRTPRAALREQLDSLAAAAGDLVRASREHDVDALFTQGNFLQTKYSRSDLDL